MDVDFIISQISKKYNEQLKAFLLAYFGDEETARAEAHNFTLEHFPSSITPEGDGSVLTLRSEFRIRRKTLEEMENNS